MKDKRVKDSDIQKILECFNKGEYHEAEKFAKSLLLKESENLYSLVQMTLFSGNIPPVSLVDLLADSIQVDSAMVFFQTEDSLSTGFDLEFWST